MMATRTPRNTLSRELVVTIALEVMEAGGVESFSIRGVAKELGVGPMALYTYFRSKDDLFDAVRNRLLGSLRTLMLAHPCLAHLLAARPLSGHETAATAEGLLRVLRDAGFDPQVAARTHTALFTFVLGATTWELQMAAERGDPERARRLRATMAGLSADDFPTVVELSRELAATTGGDAQFDYGLDLVIAGLEQRVTAASS
jgi:AcrR family transcriptional regulator